VALIGVPHSAPSILGVRAQRPLLCEWPMTRLLLWVEHTRKSLYLLAPRELMPHGLYRMLRVMKNKLSGGVTGLIVVNYCE
jgi:hypothetical protein